MISRLGTGISLTFLQFNVSVYNYPAERQLQYIEKGGECGGGKGSIVPFCVLVRLKRHDKKPTSYVGERAAHRFEC